MNKYDKIELIRAYIGTILFAVWLCLGVGR